MKTENAYTKQFEINALRRNYDVIVNDYEVHNNLTLYKVSFVNAPCLIIKLWSEFNRICLSSALNYQS